MSTLASFHFIQPHWLWLLLLVPPLAWLVARRQPGTRVLARLADPALLPHLLDGAPMTTRAPAVAFASAAILAVFALAGPTWSRQTQQLYAGQSAQVVVLSMSPHMLSHDVVPDRLSRARYKVRELYRANASGLNALIAYTGEPFTVAPLTTDAHSVDDLLNALSPDTMPVDGDDPGKAIDMAVELIRHAGLHGGSIVLVTDHADAAADAAARRARAAGDRVSVLGIGTTRGGPITSPDGGFVKDAQGTIVMGARDDASLSALAAAGGGRFVPVANDGSDVATLSSLLKDDGEGTLVAGATSGQWQDRGPWLLLPLLPLVALVFRRGWLIVLALAVLPLSPARAADGLGDVFRTRDQQAAHALAAGEAAKAQSLATTSSLRGAAAYRAGDYAAAVAALKNGKDSDSQYNLGNALAKQQRYEDALAAYDRALKANPGNADAAANRKAVDDFLKQQQQQQKPQDKNDDRKGQGGKQGDKSAGKQGQNDPKNPQGSQGGQDNPAQGGQDNTSSGDKGDDKGSPPSGDPSKAGEGEGKDRSASQDAVGEPQGDAKASSEAQRAEAQKAQSALKQQLDAALGKDGQARKSDDKGAHDLGVLSADDASSKLPADVRRSLMRVPDDPGGLLRRKFMLEYQQRHGAEPEE
ncbi:tetratricopeptide repeat protein [Luteibacter sp. PPL552]